MNPGEIGILVGTVVAAIATAVTVVVRSLRQQERRRRESEAPPDDDVVEAPRKREPTGRHRIASAELVEANVQGEIMLIREIVVSLQQSAAEAAGDRVRDLVSRETVARIAELVEQLYTSHQRRAGDHERALRHLQRTLDEVLAELRRRDRGAERSDPP